MTYSDAVNTLHEIRGRYSAIPRPVFKNADLEVLESDYALLQNLKDHLHSYGTYPNLINGISQTISKIKKTRITRSNQSGVWKNISEHGLNKTLRIVVARYHKDADGEYVWNDKYGDQSIRCKSNFTANHFIFIDVVAYLFLLNMNDDTLPDTENPIFDNMQIVQNFLNDPAAMPSASFEVQFDDGYFRKFSGLNYPSNRICDFLEELAGCDFKLTYPVMLVGESGRKKEYPVKMQSYSKLFDLTINDIKRADGKILKRLYAINFSTILGFLFVHNLMMRNYGIVANLLYGLTASAQIFYRKFILSNNLQVVTINLEKVVAALNFTGSNKNVIRKTIRESVLVPLKKSSFIDDFKFKDGLLGVKIVVQIKR